MRFEHADKIAHFGLFFILAGSLHLAFRPRVWVGLLLLLVYGIVIEVVQHYVPGRGADPWDLVADMVGRADILCIATRRENSAPAALTVIKKNVALATFFLLAVAVSDFRCSCSFRLFVFLFSSFSSSLDFCVGPGI